MAVLSFIEKEVIKRLFGIADGYIFKYWSDKGEYSKNTTQQLILEACNIDIYKDYPYKNLSQQKCVEKIWNECNPKMVANLLEKMAEYFDFAMVNYSWCEEDGRDYWQIQEIIKRLRATPDISLPEQNAIDLKLILSDIEANVQAGKPELVIDRLHTFATVYFRETCQKHGIDVTNGHGKYCSLDALAGKLKRWYANEGYFPSEFCTVAIGSTISIFEKYNELRNDFSAAHPNRLLQKAEAEYAVKIVAATLMFIDNIEKSRIETYLPWEAGSSFTEFDVEIPF